MSASKKSIRKNLLSALPRNALIAINETPNIIVNFKSKEDLVNKALDNWNPEKVKFHLLSEFEKAL